MTTGTWRNARIGNWHLVEFLGAGGMGEVYRGVNTATGEEVAVKMLTMARESPALRARFANEARIHSRLSHPGIARMIAFTSHQNTPAIVMEYVDGVTLDAWLAAHGPMPIPDAIACMDQLIAAIDYLHQRGTVHRDIKSSNVKLTSAGRVKLLDFGIAKGPDSPTLTADGSVIGTLQSLAPEQLAGAPADTQSEIWALGVLLYELVTGRHPFAHGGIEGITSRIRRAKYPTPSSAHPGLPSGVDAVIGRCLRVDPRSRYASCSTLRAELARLTAPSASGVSRALSKLPALPALPPIPDGVRRYAPVAIAAFFALLTLGFALVSLWQRPAPRIGPDSPGRNALDVAPAAAQNATHPGALRTVTINTVNGAADVWQDNALVGTTPYRLRLPIGTEVHVTLRRIGYHDEEVRFNVTEGRSEYSFLLRALAGRPQSSRPSTLPLLLGFAWFGLPWRRRKTPPPVRPSMETLDRPAISGQGLGAESRVIIGTASDPGCHRTNNEDTLRVVRSRDENGPLLAMVCDGMGGHAAGEQASRIAAETIVREFRPDGDLGEALARAVRHANREVFRAASADPALQGMGTTCTALALHGGLAWCAHVGDSRCYLIRGNQILVMTEDHSAVMALVREGAISREEAREHPDKNVISRALGSHADLEVATWPRPFVVRPGDRFLLSSDGLHDVLPESVILEVVDSLPPHLACHELVRQTREAGAPDNVSVVILGFPIPELESIAVTQASRVVS